MPRSRLSCGATAEGATLKDCRVAAPEAGVAELKANRITCATARRVYRASLRAAKTDPSPTRFRHAGRRWTCRATHPAREIDGQFVISQWRCAARGDRVSRYRWLAGD